ncbi:MAG: AEC family transporter [SAR324 cluster bacterium]|nr:AEC family transporter [SAR324 cluster bacterium]
MPMFGQIFAIFIDVVAPVFALVLIGYLVGPRLNLDARTLSRTAYFIFVPAFIFNSISTAKIELSATLQIVFYIVIVHLIVAILGFGLAKILRRPKELVAAYVMIAVFGNTGNFGLSLIDFRLGPSSQIPATVYFLTTLTFGFVVSVGIARWTRGGKMAAVLSVLKTPALLALIPALFFPIMDLEVPLMITRLTGLMGRVMIPLMLFTLGVQMAFVSKPEFSIDMILASGIRLLAAPLVAAVVAFFLGISGVERAAGIIQSGMPVAVLISIIAIEYNILPEFVTTSVLFSTLVSLLTATVVLYLV